MLIDKFDETCQRTVPVALWIIQHSKSFEDAISQAVALGADADTLGAFVGSIAEAWLFRYLAIVDKQLSVIGQDDAAKAEWFPINALPTLAFDHDEIMADALNLYNNLSKS